MAQPDHALAALGEQDAAFALTARLQRLDDEIRQLLAEVDRALAAHAESVASPDPLALDSLDDLSPGIVHAGTTTLH